MFEQLTQWLDPEFAVNMVVAFVPKAVAAVVVFTFFWLLQKFSRPPLRSILERAEIDPALVNLLVNNLYRIAVIVFGAVMAASQLGIDVGAALAGIGVAGIAIGFAAQDSIANTIAGFLIFWDKPFQVGHFVTTEDNYGEVTNITMRTTRIRTNQNTYAIIPNKEIIAGVIINHSMYGETRVDVPVGIAYKEDITKARQTLLTAMADVEGVLDKPTPDVVVSDLGGSSVNLLVRVWIADASIERPIFFRVTEASKLALDRAGIEIPFPHLQLFVDDVEERVWNRAAELASS